MTHRQTASPKRNTKHAGQRVQRREEAQRRKRLRDAKYRDIDTDQPFYTWQWGLERKNQ